MRKEKSIKNINKHFSFYTKESGMINVYFSNMPKILLIYKEVYFNINNFNSFISSVVISLLQNFEDDIG